jgi:monoamine oxidase
LPGAGGILGAFVNGAPARELARLAADERASRFVDLLERVHPGARSHAIGSREKIWDDDPYARGAYACMRTNYLTRHLPVLTRPHGRLHFAGDYTSYRPGFMHGALASAMRVVAEVIAEGP